MTGVVIDVGVNSSKAQQDLKNINSNLISIGESARISSKGLNNTFAGGRSLNKLNNSVNETTSAFKRFSVIGPAALNGVAHSLDDVAHSSVKADSSMKQLGRTVAYTTAALTGLFAALSGLKNMDVLTELQSKLKLVTKSAVQLVQAQEQLVKLSIETRSSFANSINIYFSLARSMEQVGASQEDLFKTTEAIQKAIAVSGTSAESAAAALMQLSQGLASGTLRGEELNSVLEQIPRVGKAIADAFNTNVGNLRILAEAGELTTDKVFSAILKSADSIRTEFAKTNATFSQGLAALSDGFMFLSGSLNLTLGITQAFYDASKKLADNLFILGNSLGTTFYNATQEIGNFLDTAKDLSTIVDLKALVFNGQGSLFDLTKVNAELKGMHEIIIVVNSISKSLRSTLNNITDQVDKVISTFSMSISELFRLLSGVGYAFASLFATFRFMIPDIRGPVREIVGTVKSYFLTLSVAADAATAAVVRPVQRFIEGFAEGLSLFFLWDTRVQRAWVTLANSKGLEQLTDNFYSLGAALQTRNIATYWLVLQDKVNILRGWTENFKEVLMYLNLIDNRFLFLNNIRLDRLVFALKTVGLSIKYLFTDVLYPKFGPAIASMYANAKLVVSAFSDAIQDNFQPKKIGKGLAKAIKSAFNYIGELKRSLKVEFGIDISLDKIKESLSRVLPILLNTVLSLIRGIVKGLNAFADEIDFKGFFNSLIEKLKEGIDQLDAYKMGAVFGKFLKSIFKFASETINSLDLNISFFKGDLSFKTISIQIMKGMKTLLNGIKQFIEGFANELEIATFTKKLSNKLLNAIISVDYPRIASKLYESLSKAIANLLPLLDNLLLGMKSVASNSLSELFDRIPALSSKLNKALIPIRSFANEVISLFHTIWDKVVGHSYWPDTIEGVIRWSSELTRTKGPIETFANNVIKTFSNIYSEVTSSGFLDSMKDLFQKAFSNVGSTVYNAMTNIAAIALAALGARFLIGQQGFETILAEQVISSGVRILHKFADKLVSLSQFLYDTLARIVTHYVSGIVETLDTLIAIVPRVLTSIVDDMGLIGQTIAGTLSLIPKEIIVASVVGLVFALRAAIQGVPEFLATNLWAPLVAGFNRVMAATNIADSFIYKLIFSGSHPAAVAASILTAVTLIFDSVTALGASLVGVPWLYLILMGDNSTVRLLSDINRRIISPVFGSLLSSINNQIQNLLAKLNIDGLINQLKAKLNIGQPTVVTRPSQLAVATRDLFEQIKTIYQNVARNWAAYSAGRIGFWNLIFQNQNGTFGAQGFSNTITNLSGEIRAAMTRLWASIRSSRAGQSISTALVDFTVFSNEVKRIFTSIRQHAVTFIQNIGPPLIGIVTTIITTLRPLFNAFMNNLTNFFNSVSGQLRKLLIAVGIMGAVFTNSASASQGAAATTGLAISFGELAVAVFAAAAAFKLYNATVAALTAMRNGATFVDAFKANLVKALSDIAMLPVQIIQYVYTLITNILRLSNGRLRAFLGTVLSFSRDIGVAFLTLLTNIGSAIMTFIRSGALSSLASGLASLLLGIAQSITVIPTKIGAALNGLLALPGKLKDALVLLFSFKSVLVLTGVALTAFFVAGVSGSGSFYDNIIRSIRALSDFIGLTEKAKGKVAEYSVSDKFKSEYKFNNVSTNIKESVAAVDFGQLTDRQLGNLQKLTTQSSITLNTLQKVYNKNGQLTEEQARRAEQAINKTIDSLAALPQKADNIRLDKVLERVNKQLAPSNSWFDGIANLFKLIFKQNEKSAKELGYKLGEEVSNNFATGVLNGRGNQSRIDPKSYVSVISKDYPNIVSGAIDGEAIRSHIANKSSNVRLTKSLLPEYSLTELDRFTETVTAKLNSLKINVSKEMFPDLGVRLRESIKSYSNELTNLKPYLTDAEFNQYARSIRDVGDAFEALNSSTLKTTNEERILNGELQRTSENYVKLAENLKKTALARQEAILEQSWFDAFAKRFAKSASGNSDNKVAPAIASLLGYKEWADKRSLNTVDLISKDEIATVDAYLKKVDDIREELLKISDISERGLKIRVDAAGIQNTAKKLNEIYVSTKLLDKSIDLSIDTSKLEITKRQFYDFYKDNTDQAEEWLALNKSLAESFAILLQYQSGGGDATAISNTLDQIKVLEDAIAKANKDIKLKLPKDYFEEFNKNLQDAGVEAVSADVYAALSDKVRTEYDSLFKDLKTKKEEMAKATTFEAWLAAFKQMRDIASQVKNIMGSLDSNMGLIEQAFGAKDYQVGILKNSTYEKNLALAQKKAAYELGIKTSRAQDNAEGVRVYSELRAKIEPEIEATSKTFQKASDTGKELSKTLTDAFNNYLKKSGVENINLLDYAKLDATTRQEVNNQLESAKKLNEELGKLKITEKPTKEQIDLLLKINAIGVEIKSTMDNATESISSIISKMGQVYENFSIASWFEIPGATKEGLTEIVRLISELNKQLEKPKSDLDAMTKAAEIYKQLEDKKRELKGQDYRYKNNQDASGIGEAYAKISAADRVSLRSLRAELADLQAKFESASIMDGEIIQEAIKKKLETIDTFTAKALSNFPIEQTKFALSKIGITASDAIYSASQIELEEINKMSDIILQATKAMKETDNPELRQAAYNIVSDTTDKLNERLEKLSKNSMKEAGKSFATTVQDSFNSGVVSILKGEKTFKEGLKDILNTFTSTVIDTFVRGLTEPFTGENGIVNTILKQLGSSIFGIGSGKIDKLFGNTNADQLSKIADPSKSAIENLASNQQVTLGTQQVGLQTQMAASLAQVVVNTGLMAGKSVLPGSIGPVGVSGAALGPLPRVELPPTPVVKEVIADTSLSEATTQTTTLFNKIYEGFTTTFGDIWKNIQNFGSGVKDLFTNINIPKLMADIGENIGTVFKGIVDGVKAVFSIISSFFATGGYVQTFATGGAIKAFAAGGKYGKISGPGTGTSDSILARVSNGEYIINARKTAIFKPLLDAINYGTELPAYASGGAISTSYGSASLVKAADKRNQDMGLNQHNEIHLNITGDISRQTRIEVLKLLPQIASGTQQIAYEKGRR